jgi:hypothetical protein
VHEDVRTSRLRISRRRAIGLGGAVGLTGVLAACAGAPATTTSTAAAAPTGPSAAPAGSDLIALEVRAATCGLGAGGTQGR